MNHNNLDRLWAKHAPFAISIEDFKSWPTEDQSFHAIYIFTDSNGDKTADLINKPEKVLKIVHGSDLRYQDQDADGNDIFIPTKLPKTREALISRSNHSALASTIPILAGQQLFGKRKSSLLWA